MTRTEDVRAMMAKILDQPLAALADDAALSSLVNNSFILVEMIIEMQEGFGVRFRQADMEGVTTAGRLIALFVERMD